MRTIIILAILTTIAFGQGKSRTFSYYCHLCPPETITAHLPGDWKVDRDASTRIIWEPRKEDGRGILAVYEWDGRQWVGKQSKLTTPEKAIAAWLKTLEGK